MKKVPLEILVDNMPTFAAHYREAPVTFPSRQELEEAAKKILLALHEEGYHIVESEPF